MNGWIGVDLDGTLAEYDKWRGVDHIGEPVPAMLNRVREWLAAGKRVKIFTARVAARDVAELKIARETITAWCKRHIGYALEVTNVKDMGMIELWDDRCVQVEINTGRRLDGR